MKKLVYPLTPILAALTLGLSATAHGQQPTLSVTPAAEDTRSNDILAQNTASPRYGSSASGMSTGMDENRYSVMPYTRNGYVGLNLGRSDYDLGCGTTGPCDLKENAGKIYTGGMITPYFGIEFGYLHMGNIDRGGGDTRAHGLNLSVVGRLPIIKDSLSLFAKAGATYGRTRVRGTEGGGITTGRENDFGPSYGAGIAYDFSRNWTVVAEWERHKFKFANTGRENVDAATVGVKYRF